MRVLFGCLFSAFLTGLFANLYAQSPSSAIKGRALIENHLPAESSTIILLNSRDSSIVNSTIVGKDGLFQFTDVIPGGYILLATKLGYDKSYSGPYQVLSGQVFLTNDIVLKAGTKQLKEVSVVSNRPAVEVHPGMVILNIQNSIIDAGSTAYYILRGSAGVRVDNNNNISISGRQSALITIDGKPTNLSGDDLVSVLRSMQSSTIDHIELITSASAKYDASGGGIINIVSKEGKNTGVNATVTASGAYGKYGKNSLGIVFNDHMDKFNVFGFYNYSYNNTFHNFTSDRIINFNNVMSDYNGNYTSTQNTYSNNYSLGTDYSISPNHTIGFLISGYSRTDNFAKNNTLQIANQSVLDSTIISSSALSRHYTSINYNFNYKGKLDKAGTTLSADFNYTDYNRSSDEFITNTFFDATGASYRAPLLLQNLSPSNIRIWLSKIDFSSPLSKTAKLEAGLKYSDAISNNNLVFGPKVNGVYTSDPNFSNTFLYDENVNAAYVNYQGKFDKFDLTAGLRAEQTIATGNSVTSAQIVNSNYIDLFPQVFLSYKYDGKNDFSISFNRGIKRPAYEDLNPFLYYNDLYDYRSGNPNLKPQYTNAIELSYNYNKAFLITLYNSILTDAYEAPFYQQNDATKVNITTRENLGRVYSYGIKAFVPIVFTNWWNASFGVNAAYQRYVAYSVNGYLDKGTQDISFSSTQSFIINKTLSAEVTGKYESPFFYGVNQFKSNYAVDAGISQQLFNKRGSLKLSVSDIFNTLLYRNSTNYQNLNLTIVDKRESQVGRLTFTYRFGRSSIKTASTHTTGAEDEQKRAGGAGSK
jgi:iron complex outermembrane receptor protein